MFLLRCLEHLARPVIGLAGINQVLGPAFRLLEIFLEQIKPRQSVPRCRGLGRGLEQILFRFIIFSL